MYEDDERTENGWLKPQVERPDYNMPQTSEGHPLFKTQTAIIWRGAAELCLIRTRVYNVYFIYPNPIVLLISLHCILVVCMNTRWSCFLE